MITEFDMFDFSVYVHYPFCLSKCPYCDFNSHVNQIINIKEWLEAYQKALFFHKENYPSLGKVKTIFFGGGTPSLMPPILVEGIINAIEDLFGFASLLPEITLEANPTSSEAQKFQDFYHAGVNRLSMGIQSLNDQDLRFLGRTHSAQEAIKAFDIAKKYFPKTSFDLIYARQNQTLKAWESELRQATDLSVGHISLYQLTIEQGTRFKDWYERGKISIPSDELAEELYFLTDDILSEHGYVNYEISNYAKIGQECQHNLNYWNYMPYIGIGAGAHGRVPLDNQTYLATETKKMPQDWLEDPCEFISSYNVTEKEYDIEYLLMSLRLYSGCDILRLQTNILDFKKIEMLAKDNMINLNNHQLQVTPKGRPLLNAILREITI